MKHGITDKSGRIICDPITYDKARFADIITRYSGIAANLPDTAPAAPVECGHLLVLPAKETRDQQPKPFGYQPKTGQWAVVENQLQRHTAWEPLTEREAIGTEAKQHLAYVRWQSETNGLTLPDGNQIRTDRESQAQLTSAYQSLKSGLIPDTQWKAATGWVTVTLTELEPIAQAVAAHVRACFAAEKAVSDQIDNATTDALIALDIESSFNSALTA